MTNAIAFQPKTTRETGKGKMFPVIVNLIKAIAHYEIKMEKSYRQLFLISKVNQRVSIREKAELYLTKQAKLSNIAEDLKNRMIEQIAAGTINKEQEDDFVQEVDLLNCMHFEVAKSYASFISRHFEALTISLSRPKAA